MAEAKLKKEIELLKFKRDSFVSKIDLLYNKSQSLSVIEHSSEDMSEFKVRFERLQAHYEGFLRYQNDIAKSFIQLKEVDELTTLQELTNKVDVKYFHILAVKDQLLPTSGKTEPKVTGSTANLPKINLPVFDGTLKEWPQFKDLFTALVYSETSISEIEKFHFLVSCTKNEANALVRSLPICAANFELVWKQLNDRYDNKRLLACQYIDEILNLQSITSDNPRLLRNLLDMLTENTMALKSMQIPGDLSDFIILHTALKKLDKNTRQLFERKFSEKEYPSLEDLFSFLKDHCKSLDAAQGSNVMTVGQSITKIYDSRYKPNARPNKYEKVVLHKSFLSKTETPSCLYCNEAHAIYSCPAYCILTPASRRDFIKSKEACFNCLSSSHMLNKCNSTHSCRKCHKRHHTSLHEDRILKFNSPQEIPSVTPADKGVSNNKFNNSQLQEIKSSSKTDSTSLLSSTDHSHPLQVFSTILLGTALIHIQDAANNFQQVRALIDPGSQSSFITDACVQKLGITRTKCNKNIVGLSQTSVNSTKGQVSCVIKPVHMHEPQLVTKAIVLNNITSELPSTPLSKRVVDYFKEWSMADSQYYKPSKVEFLIGANLFPLIFDGGRVSTPAGFPTPFKTVFGWVLIGEVDLPHFETNKTLMSNHVVTELTIEDSLKRFWEIEEPPQARKVSPQDIACEQLFCETVYREHDGRYVVKLPFKDNSPDIGTSFEKAERNLLSLENRFSRDEKLKSAYVDFMTEYETLGHMSHFDSKDATPLYIIPHHGIFKNSESDPKLRVVFNASAPSSNGTSLNDKLFIGPKLQNDVSEILSRFRLHPFVITADICKMYRQILVHPDHRPYQTILWRSKPSDPLKIYYLNTVTYGMSSSPYLAIRTLKQLVHDEGHRFPLASQAVLADMFVDDCLTGSHSLESLYDLKSQLINLLALGGFPLGKWASNVPSLLNDVHPQLQNDHLLFKSDSDENQSIKVLGLKWNPTSDTFSYDVPFNQIDHTKRGILSYIARIFDPLGLVSPVVFWAKCVIQQIWTLGLDWDQKLPEELLYQSIKFFEEFHLLRNLRIPRAVVPQDFKEIQLHGFSDASESGYGCAIYVKVIGPDGSNSINLVMAKSKVAPLKRLTVPKLELCGALLLSKTMKFYQTIISCKSENPLMFAWTDSTVVLQWIRTSPHLLKTFVANRVADIQRLIDPSRWRYTPTSTNPADPVSRGLMPHQLLDFPLWWKGPDWLKGDFDSWPTLPTCSESSETDDQELGTESLTVAASTTPLPQHFVVLESFSSFILLRNVVGWILRFIHNSRCNKYSDKITQSYLNVEEKKSALSTIIKTTQHQHFKEAINLISKGKTCTSLIQRLHPFLDDNGILRVGGRLRNSQLNYDQKHPILLPKRSHLSTLLIHHYHDKYFHVGPRTLQSLISREFWIISARQLIRQCLSKCMTCARFKAKSLQPYMGNLPAIRLEQTRPFLRVGVDFGGPYLTKSDKLRKPQILKSYICLFICMSTKAIHLELVSSLTTEAFLAALTRFVSRRGLCTDIYSDQGTNFVGANRELTELHTLLSQPPEHTKVISHLTDRGINWHFNPPASPHFGGLWEAGIKSTKSHLKRILTDQPLTFEEFSTLLTQIEAILNSRPLCTASDDPNELELLTPGHFLIGQPLVALPQPDYTELPPTRLSRWQLLQQATRHFWKRWSQEYLHQLQQRQKWFTHQPNLTLGDVVLIKDQNLPPLSWKMGRISELFPGADGIVRVVGLCTPHGYLKRPVNKLCPLPVKEP